MFLSPNQRDSREILVSDSEEPSANKSNDELNGRLALPLGFIQQAEERKAQNSNNIHPGLVSSLKKKSQEVEQPSSALLPKNQPVEDGPKAVSKMPYVAALSNQVAARNVSYKENGSSSEEGPSPVQCK